MLCTFWDPIVFTSMEYIKLNHLCDVHVTPFETPIGLMIPDAV